MADSTIGQLNELLAASVTGAATIPIEQGVETYKISAASLKTFAGAIAWGVASTSQTIAQNKGYLVTAPSRLLFALPTSPSVGDQFAIALAEGAGGWRITQAGAHSIQVGNKTTTAGSTGRIDSTAIGDFIQLVCFGADLWVEIGIRGNLEVV